jgi:hypothetical protein
VIPAEDSLTHLPELSLFLAVKPGSGSPLSNFPERLFFLIETLGTILAGLRPVGFRQFVSQHVIRIGSRRGQLHRQVAAMVNEALRSRFAPAVAKQLKKDIKKEVDRVKRAAVVVQGRTKTINTTRVTLTKTAQLAGLPELAFLDLGVGVPPAPTSLCTSADLSGRRQRYIQFMEKVAVDEALSWDALQEMIGQPMSRGDGNKEDS